MRTVLQGHRRDEGQGAPRVRWMQGNPGRRWEPGMKTRGHRAKVTLLPFWKQRPSVQSIYGAHP